MQDAVGTFRQSRWHKATHTAVTVGPSAACSDRHPAASPSTYLITHSPEPLITHLTTASGTVLLSDKRASAAACSAAVLPHQAKQSVVVK